MAARRSKVTAATAMTLAVVGGAVLAGCGSAHQAAGRTSAPPSGSVAPASTGPATAPPTTPKPPPPPSGRPYGVGSVTDEYVEPAGHVVPAPFAPRGAPSAPRKLEVQVLYPSSSPASGQDVPLAPPDSAGGPFPVVVFAPGLNETPSPYQPLLHDWAQAGFVVEAVTFPVTNPAVPNAGNKESDLPNQPYDVTFVLDSLLASASRPTDPLHQVIDGNEIAVSGQSDGGNTTLAVGYNTAYQDHRVDAAVVLSGARYGFPGGTWFPPGSPPMLAIQGTADAINPPSLTNEFFTSDPQPDKYLLCLQGASHLGPYTERGTYEALVAQVSIDFLDGVLYHRAGALDQMQQAGDSSGSATFAPHC